MQEFQNIYQELLALIDKWEDKLHRLSDDDISNKQNSQNRTIKQIVGHMVDSATNNTHRVVHLQYQESPCHYPDYANLGNNDRWIAIQNYQDEDWKTLIQLWKYTNMHFAYVITQVNPKKLEAIWMSALGQEINLEAMIVDFPRHFKLHLGEVGELMGN